MNNSVSFKKYNGYCNSNKIFNILTSALVALIFSVIAALIFKKLGFEIYKMAFVLVISILTILSFVFQNDDQNFKYFLSFVVILICFLIIDKYDNNINVDYLDNQLRFDPTLIICLIDIIILITAKIKYENIIPLYLRVFDIFNAFIDGIKLKKYINNNIKEVYSNVDTNYINKLNIEKENLVNSIRENYIEESQIINNLIYELNSKENNYLEQISSLKEKTKIIDEKNKMSISATEKYHLLTEKEKIFNDRLGQEANLKELKSKIFVNKTLLNNLKLIYELNIQRIENDYRLRYLKYIDCIKLFAKGINISYKEIYEEKKGGKKNELVKEDTSIS